MVVEYLENRGELNGHGGGSTRMVFGMFKGKLEWHGLVDAGFIDQWESVESPRESQWV